MNILSILIGKLVFGLLRLTGRTGSALPGLIVERLDKNFVKRMLGKLPEGVVVVSGTNGKTTTTKIITSLCEANSLKVLTNKTGSNFVRGIISTIIQHATVGGKLPYDIAIFEQDEAHAVHLARMINPKGVVALNVMRDQMDRFGEIDTTTKMLQKLVSSATDWVVLNAADERIRNLKAPDGTSVLRFAHSEKLHKDFLSDDQLYDVEHSKYDVSGDLFATLEGYDSDGVDVKLAGKKLELPYVLQGSHNAINLVAALSALQAIRPKASTEVIVKAVSKLEPAFGRGESFITNEGVRITLQLVKNPAGFMHALRMLEKDRYGVVGIAINDDYADGRDVSWLWDVDFSGVNSVPRRVFTSGVRAADMAVRLKYDEVKTESVDADLGTFVGKTNGVAAETGKEVIIYSTYTAMLALRDLYKTMSKQVYEVEV